MKKLSLIIFLLLILVSTVITSTTQQESNYLEKKTVCLPPGAKVIHADYEVKFRHIELTVTFKVGGVCYTTILTDRIRGYKNIPFEYEESCALWDRAAWKIEGWSYEEK